MKSTLINAVAASALLAGCFTVTQSEFPEVQMQPAPKDAVVRIQLSGFETTFTSYLPVYGYSTMWVSEPGYYRRGRYYGGWSHPETVSTTTYVPRTELTTAYAEMAQDAAESAGFVVSPTNAQYAVDVKFSGPVVTDGDRVAEAACMLLSLLTADYTAETWSARLKITATASGKVVFLRSYEQKYSASAWGLVPLFGPLSADVVSSGYSKNWCLSALTRRTMADATAFMAAGTSASAE